MRLSFLTWYAANTKDTLATLTIRGRTIFRVVRIGTPQSKYEDGPRGLGAGGRVDYDCPRPARKSRVRPFSERSFPKLGSRQRGRTHSCHPRNGTPPLPQSRLRACLRPWCRRQSRISLLFVLDPS